MAKDRTPIDDDMEDSEQPEEQGKKKKQKKEKPPKEPKPKKEKQGSGEEGENGNFGKRILSAILKFFLYAAIVGGICAFLFFNWFGLRQKYVIPQIRKIPVVKNYVPLLPGEEVEIVDETNPDSALSKKQLLEKIAMLEGQIVKLTEESESKEQYIAELNERVMSLQQFADNEAAFRQEQEEFNEMIANGDPDAFAAFYEQVDPATAERIYAEVVKKNEADAEILKYTATFQEMRPANAAGLLEEMIRTDPDRVEIILRNVDNKQRADILSAMQPRNAAVMTRRLVPVQ